MTRHTNGEIVWTGTQSNQSTYALDSAGARYTIDRLKDSWIISYLPLGSADKGRTPVPWLPGRRSLTTAKRAVAVHHDEQVRSAASVVGLEVSAQCPGK